MEQEDILRDHLIKLSNESKINIPTAKIRKMKLQQLQDLYDDYKAKELDELNEMFTDVLIIKLEDLLKYTQLIHTNSHLAKKLQDKKLFRADVKTFVSYITPILPFAGLLEGAVVIGNEVLDNFSENKNDETNTTSSTQEGDQ